MQTHQLESFTDGALTVKHMQQQREVVRKKDVPPAIWNQYAIPQPVHFYRLLTTSSSGKSKNTTQDVSSSDKAIRRPSA